MSAADPIPLDALSDENRAILSLLLVQGRSYREIAELLHLDPVRVRDRAHAAIGTLAPPHLGRPGTAARARIADYLVGEQSVSERALTRAQLAGSESERTWAAAIALALAPVAKHAVPVIPDPAAPADPDPKPAVNPETTPPVDPDPTPPADPETTPPVDPEPDPTPRPAADRDPDRNPPSHRATRAPGAVILCLGLFALVALAVILIVANSGGRQGQRTPAVAIRAGRTIERLVLSAAGTNRGAVGAAAIVRPARGDLLLLLQGRGLPVKQNHSYAVWLFNKPGDSRLLGFISPDAGAAGTFSSGAPLPSDAARFHELIVTLEVTSRPIAPGHAVLKTPLRLAAGSGRS